MHNVNIKGAVGRGGKNFPDDVRKVQTLLNEQMRSPLRPLVVDGACGGDTILAIEDFQRRELNMPQPDGKCDPQGKTMGALSPIALTRSPEILVPYRDGQGLYVKNSGSKSLFGTHVDIRPLRKDKKNEAVEITDAAYSRELTKAMVGYMWEAPNVQFILFNDMQIPGVTWAKGHHNHLHVRFKE